MVHLNDRRFPVGGVNVSVVPGQNRAYLNRTDLLRELVPDEHAFRSTEGEK